MFGTNVPKLLKLITQELSMLGTKQTRPKYDIMELQPEEVARKKAKEDAEAEAIYAEEAERERSKRNYINYVTDVIMDTLGDIGVTIFGPQVSRDMFKKINEPAELLKLQCKDRKFVPVTSANFELVNSVCTNGLSADVIEQLDKRELLICFWKMPEDRRSVVDTMFTYVNYLTHSHVEPPSVPGGEETKYPAVIFPMELRFEKRLTEDEPEIEEPVPEAPEPSISNDDLLSRLDEEQETEDSEEGVEGVEGAENLTEGLDINIGLESFVDDEALVKEEEEQAVIPESTSRVRIKKVVMPPVWVPNTNRAHAALVYIFFRNQTTSFLPPDPVPEPPHVVMAFDAYKKKDLLDLYSRHRTEVPYYGFFTSDDVKEAKLIATDLDGYLSRPAQPSDKIIFRVNKQTSHLMLAFAHFGPSYVSANTVQGKEEALRLFPENYGTKEETKDEETGKKKKKKTGKKEKEDKKENAAGDESTPTVTSTEGVSTEAATPETVEHVEETAQEVPSNAAVSEDGATPAEPTEQAPTEQAPAAPVEGAEQTSLTALTEAAPTESVTPAVETTEVPPPADEAPATVPEAAASPEAPAPAAEEPVAPAAEEPVAPAAEEPVAPPAAEPEAKIKARATRASKISLKIFQAAPVDPDDNPAPSAENQ